MKTYWAEEMDEKVFSRDIVGRLMNEKFVSVRYQADSTPNDNEEIVRRRTDVQALQKQYPIHGYPTFLFFAPDGKLKRQGLGFLTESEFLSIARSSLAPADQSQPGPPTPARAGIPS